MKTPTKVVIEPPESDIAAALAEVAAHPEIALSRREILRFILVEPTKRSEEIQTILKLDDIGQVRAALNTAQNRLQTAHKMATAQVQSSREALLTHLQLPALNSEGLLGEVNKRRALLGLPEIAELTSDTKLDYGMTSLASGQEFNKQSALRDLNAGAAAFPGVASQAAAEAAAIVTDIEKLETDPALLIAVQRRAFVEKGLALVDGPECPLCDHKWQSGGTLRAHWQRSLQNRRKHRASSARCSRTRARSRRPRYAWAASLPACSDWPPSRPCRHEPLFESYDSVHRAETRPKSLKVGFPGREQLRESRFDIVEQRERKSLSEKPLHQGEVKTNAQFCKLLKTEFADTQFIITTHDRLWAEQMKSAGLVTRKTSVSFHSWTIDTGPLVESNAEIWQEIDRALSKGKVEAAAAALRRHLEFVSRHLADQLGASPQFRADGNYELGDLLPNVLKRAKDLYGKAITAAQSWGNTAAKDAIASRKDALSASNGAVGVERWAVNKAVHYNEWANFGRKDFQPVVAAFKASRALSMRRMPELPLRFTAQQSRIHTLRVQRR